MRKQIIKKIVKSHIKNFRKLKEIFRALNFEKQVDIIKPLCNILSSFNCILDFSNKKITITKDKFKKTLVVYPAMWSEKNKEKTIYLRDSYIKYSKPFAVQKILDEIAL